MAGKCSAKLLTVTGGGLGLGGEKQLLLFENL